MALKDSGFCSEQDGEAMEGFRQRVRFDLTEHFKKNNWTVTEKKNDYGG